MIDVKKIVAVAAFVTAIGTNFVARADGPFSRALNNQASTDSFWAEATPTITSIENHLLPKSFVAHDIDFQRHALTSAGRYIHKNATAITYCDAADMALSFMMTASPGAAAVVAQTLTVNGGGYPGSVFQVVLASVLTDNPSPNTTVDAVLNHMMHDLKSSSQQREKRPHALLEQLTKISHELAGHKQRVIKTNADAGAIQVSSHEAVADALLKTFSVDLHRRLILRNEGIPPKLAELRAWRIGQLTVKPLVLPKVTFPPHATRRHGSI